jgi:hypothetical protein
MRNKLQYESNIDRREEIQAHREVIWWRTCYALLALFVAIVSLGCFAWYAMQPLQHRVTVEVINCTPTLIDGAGMDDVINHRTIEIGAVPAWESRKASVDYLADLCVAGFSFDQSGQVLRVALAGNIIGDDSAYRIKVSPESLEIFCREADGSTRRFRQSPTTQPINYSMP